MKSRYAGAAGVCAVIMEEQHFAGGCRRSRGGFSIPPRPIIRPCVLDAGVRDSRRASKRGHAGPGGWYDCAGHASSRRGPGYASCQKGLRRSRDKSCPHCVHPVHARPAQTAGAAAMEGRTAVDTENGRSAHARAIGPPGRGVQTTSPVAALSLATRRRQEVFSSRRDAWCRRTGARHASRPYSAAIPWATVQLDPERSVELTFATTKLLPTKRSAELQAPKIRSARGRPSADQPRKDRPHLFRNSTGAPTRGFASAK
jgi:hypothetical protein